MTIKEKIQKLKKKLDKIKSYTAKTRKTAISIVLSILKLEGVLTPKKQQEEYFMGILQPVEIVGGSEKQCQWALLIRDEFFDLMRMRLEKIYFRNVTEITKFVNNYPSSNFWTEFVQKLDASAYRRPGQSYEYKNNFMQLEISCMEFLGSKF